MRILVVEDEEAIAAFVHQGLTEAGYAVDLAHDGAEALQWVDIADYDLIILDIMLPEVDGLTVCRALRARGLRTPVLMLTALDAIEDRVAGLDSGADDYLIKPFAFAELRARIRALLRREPALTGPLLQVADLTLDTVTHEVHRGGQLIALTNKEYSLLEFLMRHPNQTLTRATIADHVWNYEFDNVTNVIDVHIFALRRKLDDASPAKLLHTVRGVGYRLGTGAE
ncbi:MAG: response regulator transcription factor [Ardenticatenaceae bacterium]|nr:response regulator transcription factor [Ardenticatenaceae bacterium]